MSLHDAIGMEDLVITALFGSLDPTSTKALVPQIQGRAYPFSGRNLISVCNAFEQWKEELDLGDPESFFETVSLMERELDEGRLSFPDENAVLTPATQSQLWAISW